jgi:hypothetical protein
MLKLETCVSEDCDGIAFTDHTGIYDVDDNPSGYGGPNVITGPLDFDSYIFRAWRQGTQPPDDPFTFEVDLRNATPVVNDDDQTKWEFTLAELGLTEVVSGHWYFEWIGTTDPCSPRNWRGSYPSSWSRLTPPARARRAAPTPRFCSACSRS